MKNVIIIALALFALQITAQQNKKGKHQNGERANRMEQISAEDMASLHTKRMTLHLDLNASQQAEVMKINLENATKRKEMMAERQAKKQSGDTKKPTPEERLKMANARLDHKIAVKAKMKTILNPEQFAKWEKAESRRGMKGKHKKKGHKKDSNQKRP